MLPEYTAWVQAESDKIKRAMLERAKSGGCFSAAVYFIPATATQHARLILADQKPDGATDVLRFPGIGSRVGAVAYSHLFTGIADACRSLPVFPSGA